MGALARSTALEHLEAVVKEKRTPAVVSYVNLKVLLEEVYKLREEKRELVLQVRKLKAEKRKSEQKLKDQLRYYKSHHVAEPVVRFSKKEG